MEKGLCSQLIDQNVVWDSKRPKYSKWNDRKHQMKIYILLVFLSVLIYQLS